MPSSSPERGRTRSRQNNSAFAKSQTASRTRSPPRRTISPRSGSRSKTPSRSPSVHGDRRNGVKDGRDRSRSPARSISRSRSPGRPERKYRDRSNSRSPTRASPTPKSSKIVVEKLTKNVNEDHLREIFGAYGPIRELDLPMNRQFMTNRGTAYIVYTDTPDAEAAISHMHEAQLDGAIINLAEDFLHMKDMMHDLHPPQATAEDHRLQAQDMGGTVLQEVGGTARLRHLGEDPRPGDMVMVPLQETVTCITTDPVRILGQGHDLGRSLPGQGLVLHHDGLRGTDVETVHRRREGEGVGGVLATQVIPAIATGVGVGVGVGTDVGGSN